MFSRATRTRFPLARRATLTAKIGLVTEPALFISIDIHPYVTYVTLHQVKCGLLRGVVSLCSFKAGFVVHPRTLQNIPIFEKLSGEALEHLAVAASVRTFPARHTFFKQGDVPSGLYALQRGQVKLYRQSRERMQILALLVPPECFGAESLPNNAPCPYSATALTPITTLYIPPESLQSIMREHPALQQVLLTLITGRLKQFVTLVHTLAFHDVASRVAKLLLLLAEYGGEETDEGLCIERLLSQQEMAAMVGTVREVVARTLKKMEEDGLLHYTRKKIYLHNIPALETLAAQEAR